MSYHQSVCVCVECLGAGQSMPCKQSCSRLDRRLKCAQKVEVDWCSYSRVVTQRQPLTSPKDLLTPNVARVVQVFLSLISKCKLAQERTQKVALANLPISNTTTDPSYCCSEGSKTIDSDILFDQDCPLSSHVANDGRT